MKAAFFFLLISTLPSLCLAQTCCSGGVPVSSNLGYRVSEKGSLVLGIVTEYAQIARLKSGTERLEDENRKRSTSSIIFRPAFSISDRINVEAFIPFVIQTRAITGSSMNVDREISKGIGDPIVIAFYQVVQNPFSIRLGAGPQLPLGSFSERDGRGLLLIEDMQPGSGALDLISMLMIEANLSTRPSAAIFANYIQSLNGTNERSRGGLQSYTFGNDSQFILGYSDQSFLLNQIFNYGLSLKYRFAANDRIDSEVLPATGGRFAFARINTGINIGSNNLLDLNFELPIYTNVVGTQLAPSYAINLSYSKKINKN